MNSMPPGTTFIDDLEYFLNWLKGNRFLGLMLSGGVIGTVQAVAKWVHFEGFSVAPRYFLSMLVGVLFVLVTLFVWWMRGNPQRPQGTSTLLTDATGRAYGPSVEAIFSPETRAAARWIVFSIPLIGGALVYAALPSPDYPLRALRRFVAAIDDERARIRDDSRGLFTLYERYRNARARDGERFRNNPTVATTIPTADVVEHNHQLRSVILGDLVPTALGLYAHTPRSGDLAHDISELVEHFGMADKLHGQIESLEERAIPSVFATSQEINFAVCRYWGLVLLDSTNQTGLTKFDRPRIASAEGNVRRWLDLHKEK